MSHNHKSMEIINTTIRVGTGIRGVFSRSCDEGIESLSKEVKRIVERKNKESGKHP